MATAGASAAGPHQTTADTSPDGGGGGPLHGVLVLEHGERVGAAICGSLLAQLGAEVAVVERVQGGTDDAADRAWRMLGKRSIAIRAGDSDDARLLRGLLARADLVLLSSDISPAPAYESPPHQTVTDVTAFGATGPWAGLPYSDALVQAVSGLADTTGDADGAPTLIGFPFCEVSAGIYAAAATLVAHRVRRTRGFGQRVEVALFDCAVNALSTFLPFHAIGKSITRAGNRHSLAAPWNAYRAADGWVLICTATDDQWRRLCGLIGREELREAAGYATNAERVSKRSESDAAVGAWTADLEVMQCVERLSAIDIACGPILTLDQLRKEPNLDHRAMIRTHKAPAVSTELELPGNPLASPRARASSAARIPEPDADRAYLRALLAQPGPRTTPAAAALAAQPLAGFRVLEIGQYTTAPLVARQLGALGAEVLKIEPPGGEGSRQWPPTQGNRGYFFALSNSDKRSLELDLRDEAHCAAFRKLLESADVLVENLKPGSLARLGFGPDTLQAINPRLVYCGISGFGARSAYPGRPAFDTVVQAMSGFMDVTRSRSVPMKAGISAADITGGGLALVAILAALEARDASGSGDAIDLSMQDAAVWATMSLWNRRAAAATGATIVRCTDGYLCIDRMDQRQRLDLGVVIDGDVAVAHASRAAVTEAAHRVGVAAAPVMTVTEVATSGQAIARDVIIEKAGEDGRVWPLLNSPMRLQATPPEVRRPIGELGEANIELIG